MGVSFEISRSGCRFKHKPPEAASENSAESSKIASKNESNNSTTSALKRDGRDEDAAGFCGSSLSSRRNNFSLDHEVSFTLNLFTNGYSIGKPSEENGLHASVQDAAKLLHPYDRASEALLSGIESGWLPGDILDGIPCKFVDGGLVCEVRDFRKCISDSDSIVQSAEISPTTTKVHLQMSLENVVNDIASIADDSWTYGDLMEVESRILKALQPKLSLDPTPRLDRLCQDPVSSKLNLRLSGLRRKRLREMPEITVTSSSRLHGKKISVGRLPDNSSYRLGELVPSDTLPQHIQDNIPVQNIGPSSSNLLTSRTGGFLHDSSISAMNVIPQHSKFVHGVGNKRSTQDSLSGTVLNTSASPVAHEMTAVYNDNVSSTSLPHVKMEAQEGQMSPYSGKRARLGSMTDTIHSQQIGSYMDSQGTDVQWKNQFSQHQENTRGIQYPNTSMPRYSQLGHEGAPSQDGTTVQLGHAMKKYGVSGDQIESDKLDKSEPIRVMNDGHIVEAENNHMDPRFQQRSSQQALMRSNFQPTGWNNLGQQVEKDPRKEEHTQKRKASHSPRVSSSIVAQSHLSGKSADLASGSLGIPYGAMPSVAPLGYSQREKSAGMPIPSVGRSQSGMSGANDSMQSQAQVAGKWRPVSIPKTPAMSGIGSPASISNVSMPTNAACPSVSTGTLVDQSMLEKFSKIEAVAARYKLNYKRTKADDMSRKPHTFSPQEVMIGLSKFANNENIKDDNPLMPISKSLVGGNINTLKIRVLSFSLQDRTVPGNAPAATKMRTRLIMSEKPHDGTIAMHFGDLEDREYLNAEDHLPSLPTPHFADLLASQFCTLMLRDGYYMEDHVQARPPPRAVPPSNQSNVPSIPSSGNENQQYAEAASAPQHETKPVITANATINSPPNLLSGTGMLSPGGNPQGLQMSQGLLHGASAPARPQQMETQQSIRQQHAQLPNQQQMGQQHQAQFSRSMLLPPTSHPNALGQNSNLPLASQMANKTSSLQMLQQPNIGQQPPLQPQLQSQMQRKMMMGLGPGVGMGNLPNNMVGLGVGGLGNVIGMAGARVIGGVPGVSSSMGQIPGMGNMAQNTTGMNQALNFSNQISQHLRSGTLNQSQANAILASRMRMTQNRGILGGPQSGMAGMSVARQMQASPSGLSMLNQTLGRGGNINPMQRPAMAAPRLMTGMNVHMNPQQQQQQQQMLQMQQQMQPQQQQPGLQQPQSIPEPQQQLQQQEASPLQSVVSPQQVSSPSTLGIPQQINQPGVVQQLQQQASPQMSSGAIHPTSISNPEPGPASPQVSSQTLGSVGSISNSTMDLQGVNKKNNP